MEQPAGRSPAPPPLDRIQHFANTVDRLDGIDEKLNDPLAASTWLHQAGISNDAIVLKASEHEELLAVREALRALCHRNRDNTHDVKEPVTVCNAAALDAQLAVDFGDGGRLHPQATGLNLVIGNLLATVQTAMLDTTWHRLKACRGCGWVFYDRSRSRQGRWCSMTICGNRAKNQAHRQRTTPRTH